MHQQALDPRDYPYMGDQPEKKRKAGEDFVSRGAKNIKGGGRLDQAMTDIHNNPRLFVYITGGLSHHEVVNIANLQGEIPAQIIPGSNEIYNVEEYLAQMGSLHKRETLVEFKNKIMTESHQFENDDDDELLGQNEGEADLDFSINF